MTARRLASNELPGDEEYVTATIEVTKLVKLYGPLRAVDGVDCEVRAGEVFSFLGPNGAGKTTTVEILEGLRPRTSGEVRVLGLDPWTQIDKLRTRIGVIPQDFHFFPKLTPREAIQLYARLFAVKADPDELLAQVELLDKADEYYDTLSGGQHQKLGVALALVNDPELCFLDEPTTGLYPRARRSLWGVIRRLRREGRTVFLTTHYLDEPNNCRTGSRSSTTARSSRRVHRERSSPVSVGPSDCGSWGNPRSPIDSRPKDSP